MMLELKLILLCLPSILLATTLDSDNKSILANTDWKKLWLESGQLSSSGRIDNHLDSSDSTLIDDGEVMAHNTTVQLGGVAFLVCKVAGVDRVGVNWNQISWIRRRDWHILSSGAQMYTNDERFAILHTPGSNTWTLQIKFVQRRDHGTYECQVSTPTGIISHFVNLQVVVPEAFILGSGELHVDMGSTINLVCIIEKPTATAVRVLAAQRSDDQLRRLEAGHHHRNNARATDAEPPHHPGAANQRLGQLHLLGQQHRTGQHIRVRVQRRQYGSNLAPKNERCRRHVTAVRHPVRVFVLSQRDTIVSAQVELCLMEQT
ncbi:uncharacterized protein LOC1276929 isoform X1 [Anopheles gambiae]|uniref:uncharacterized protein LOC1276929 isoform X1 n=1 Tax=Anopheles gambiae TaxID=7165 RepID=UPI002AC9DD82|nr:uncharacterized protein LOC1276929 isoform X1 [Anopheles gambiae]XP_061503627.1 uncharacterized protein LOC1276929 isoform X1 [Anopheles gambiae]XP_061503628.1 uncharacterized protein LOC1276929 isoform X1 [Anopheles gambiae]